jgi:amidase
VRDSGPMSVTTEETDLAFAGPAAQAALVRRRELHPRELVELYLRRIETHDPTLNAFRLILAEQAWTAANSLEGTDLTQAGPLVGIPFAVKDDTPLAGQATSYGSRSPATTHAADAEAVGRLRAAGGIPVGITNVPELMIFPWTATDANGITRNPWNPGHTPGGSSGGSAAAVAAGLVSAATGSDGGGSIRIPAACCGLVGMKSTRGLVPTAPSAELTLGLTVLGALGRTVADSALLLDVMAAAAGRFTAAAERGGQGSAPRRLRVAISRKVPPGLFVRISPDQKLAFERTARLLQELGHEVIERDPDYRLSSLEFTQTYLRAIHENFTALADPSLTERSTRQMAAAGRRIVPPRRRDAVLAKRPRTSERIMALWKDVDVLLTPGLARTALPAEGGYGRNAALAFDLAGRFTPWTPVFNLTGQPAISLPAGFGTDGLPLSVQLVGAYGSEELLYELSAQLELARPWAPQRPSQFA